MNREEVIAGCNIADDIVSVIDKGRCDNLDAESILENVLYKCKSIAIKRTEWWLWEH